MAKSRNILCGICEAQHVTKYADQWCPESDEGLCSDCGNHHKVSNATRHHGVITIANYYNVSSSISEIANHFEYHDMKYTHFFQHHGRISDIFCCRFFLILPILFLVSAKLCSMLSIHIDVLDGLIISRIDKSPTQYLWFAEIHTEQQGSSWC
jgi:hypothetical protein